MQAYHFIAPSLVTRYDNLQAKVGEWLEIEGKPELCRRGLHASVHPWDALTYAQADQTTLCLVELEGDIQTGDDKVCAKRRKVLKIVDARSLLQQIALFAAKQALPIFEKQFPNDSRVRDCIEVVERFLRGEATREELEAADAASAAYAAASAAASAAAYAAADAAYAAASAAAYAAADAARAARAAAYAAAYAAADAARAARATRAAADAARAGMTQRIRDEFRRLVAEAFKETQE